jgi:pimeloyl-ACP methyl ester carboxylesterase
MKLEYSHYGEGEPIVVLHGLFGSADNWATLGKRMAATHSVYLVDQRNHGRSPHSAVMTYDAMAADVLTFMNDHGLKQATLLGHSMGGKTVMRFAQLFPERVQRLVVADMGIKAYPPHHGPIFEAIGAIDLTAITSRGDAEAAMARYIADAGVRQFLLKSLYRPERDRFGWRFNHVVLEREIAHILAALPPQVCHVPALFVYGTLSNYILPEEIDSIKAVFPQGQFASMQAGHWLHAEDPDTFFRIFMEFVTAPPAGAYRA